jgi:hypothetical protein
MWVRIISIVVRIVSIIKWECMAVIARRIMHRPIAQVHPKSQSVALGLCRENGTKQRDESKQGKK